MDKIADFTGLSRTDLTDLLAKVRENIAKIKGCKRHRFEGLKQIKFGQKHRCLACDGEMSLMDAGRYIEGYEAAGGNADDIWPGYRDVR